jgi:4-hydroxy-3-methylbut-2-enyl diphosphate reductase
MTKPPLTILLAQPRGFCAGVERAINIVEAALKRHGRPVYVRHEIVHNRFVVESLEAKGAVFVDELDDVPEGRPVVFSAHGVPKSVTEDARARNMYYLDATCPLVSKVHHEAQHHARNDRQIILIGHAGHPEVEGTMGQVDEGRVLLVENVEDAEAVTPSDVEKLAYITQTTLSVDDALAITAVLRRRFPNILGPKSEDICYATTNRQNAVKAIAAQCDAVLVVGARNSSNSRRLVEVAQSAGCPRATLVGRVTEIDWQSLQGIARLGLSAGASAPEVLVQEVIDACRERFDVTLDMVTVTEETVVFNLPASLVDA